MSRLDRQGTIMVSEEMDVQIRGQYANQLVIAVDNGD